MNTVLAARGVSMQYPGTLALDGVDFEVYAGQVNVVVGENGAGKSTLMRILAGIEKPTAGRLELDGAPVSFDGARDAAARGIAMIHQELNLLPNLSVAENIFIAREQTRWGIITPRSQEAGARELMARLEQPVDAKTLVGDLPLGQQQIVEIAKAIAQDVRVLIMDEPTSALSESEIAVLFRLIADLKARGVAVVYISHRLQELMTIGDRVTVLRDGHVVAEARTADVTTPWIVEQMTGKKTATPARPNTGEAGCRLLAVRNVRGISFDAGAGEIVGFYGLLGSGRTELFETLIGLRKQESGSIILDGRSIERLAIFERIAAGLALVPEERQAAGIVPTRSVLENMMLAGGGGWVIASAEERHRASELVRELNIRTAGLDQPITSLSGGNQQKVLLARYLLRAPKVLLLDEPTRGVDVGAREEIYGLIRRIAAQGRTVLFASSELEEVLALATRVIVMSGGRMAAELSATQATEQALVAASAPIGGDPAHR
jgi:erythritol transport system ATP-binding protein